jgi:hypothetical protein
MLVASLLVPMVLMGMLLGMHRIERRLDREVGRLPASPTLAIPVPRSPELPTTTINPVAWPPGRSGGLLGHAVCTPTTG